MGVYSVLLPDSKILRRVAGFKSVVIAGCVFCANSSIAYDKGIPFSRVLVDENTGRTVQVPVAVMEESKRLKALLESNDIDVRGEVLLVPCVVPPQMQPADLELAEHCTNADAVVTLCCSGGTLGIKTRLGKTVKIIPGMRSVGISLSYTVFDETKEFIYVDKSRSKIIRMLKE